MKNIPTFLLLTLSIFLVSSCSLDKFTSKKSETRTCAMVLEEYSYDILDETAEVVFSKIEEVISQRKDLRVIDRTRFESVRSELAFQQSDWSSKEKTAEIGKALNADLICFVTIYRDTYKIEFLNVNTVQKRTFNGRYSISLIFKKISVKNLDGLKKLRVSDIGA